MQVIQDDLWLCTDCLLAAVNGDVSGAEASYYRPMATREMREAARDERIAAIEAGLAKLGPGLVPDYETGDDGHEEFSHRTCDCCGETWGGEWHRFAILGEEDASCA